MPAKELDVYLHDGIAGSLKRLAHGRLSFQYRPDWAGVPLSCALPVREEPYSDEECRPFFEGLLPEGEFLRAVARAHHVSATNPFSLLDAIGGECAGAVSLVAAGDPPPTDTRPPQWLDKDGLADLLSELPSRPLMANAEEGFRLSLAGTRDKLPVIEEEGRIGVTRGNPPSTHIIKRPVDELDGMVANEAFCLLLSAEIGLEAAEATPVAAGDQECLLVRRYDRVRDSGGARRIHQEDFCQALGFVPGLKYQAEGGPDVAACVDLIRRISAVPARDVARFLDALLFNLLIGNQDAHSKNYSLLLEGDDAPRIAPLYDMLALRVYPHAPRKFAMKIGGEYRVDRIRTRHFERLAGDFGIRPSAMRGRILSLAERTVAGCEPARRRLPEPWADAPVLDRICAFINENAKALAGEAQPIAVPPGNSPPTR